MGTNEPLIPAAVLDVIKSYIPEPTTPVLVEPTVAPFLRESDEDKFVAYVIPGVRKIPGRSFSLGDGISENGRR